MLGLAGAWHEVSLRRISNLRSRAAALALSSTSAASVSGGHPSMIKAGILPSLGSRGNCPRSACPVPCFGRVRDHGLNLRPLFGLHSNPFSIASTRAVTPFKAPLISFLSSALSRLRSPLKVCCNICNVRVSPPPQWRLLGEVEFEMPKYAESATPAMAPRAK